jgi:hypothetical protein
VESIKSTIEKSLEKSGMDGWAIMSEGRAGLPEFSWHNIL